MMARGGIGQAALAAVFLLGFFVADFIVAIFGLAMVIRLKICMLDVERADRGA